MTEKTFSANGPIKRRTIVEGAAWSIPVVATAVAAPLAAASTTPAPVCPEVRNSNLWWGRDVQGGYYQGYRGWSSSTQWTADSDANWQQGVPSVHIVTTTISVVAGATYNFVLPIYAARITPVDRAAYPQNVDFTVNGQNIFSASTQRGFSSGELSVDEQWRNYPAQYVATTTGTVELRYTFTAFSPVQQGDTNDRIDIVLPAISCVFPTA